jgi:hypothetical protein
MTIRRKRSPRRTHQEARGDVTRSSVLLGGSAVLVGGAPILLTGRYIARHGESRVQKAVLIAAVPPIMVETSANPGGIPKEVFDGLQAQVASNRAQFYLDLPTGPFYGLNRPGAKVSSETDGVRE